MPNHMVLPIEITNAQHNHILIFNVPIIQFTMEKNMEAKLSLPLGMMWMMRLTMMWLSLPF